MPGAIRKEKTAHVTFSSPHEKKSKNKNQKIKKNKKNLGDSLLEDCSKRRLHGLRGQSGRRAIEGFAHYLPNSFHRCFLSSESDTTDQPAASNQGTNSKEISNKEYQEPIS